MSYLIIFKINELWNILLKKMNIEILVVVSLVVFGCVPLFLFYKNHPLGLGKWQKWRSLLQEQMVEPAVNGTKNVIIAAAEANVRRVVFTSSIGAVYMDPNRGPDEIVDESCWSDLEFCKNTKVQFPDNHD